MLKCTICLQGLDQYPSRKEASNLTNIEFATVSISSILSAVAAANDILVVEQVISELMHVIPL